MIARRWLWILFGVTTQFLFGGLVISLMWFMQFGASSTDYNENNSIAVSFVVDVILLLFFTLSHSALLTLSVRSHLSKFIPIQLYGCFFCLETCLSLWALMYWWCPLPGIIWQLTGISWWIMMFAAAGSWSLLAYSMWITGFGYQSGFTGLHYYWRPSSFKPRLFAPRGLYRSFRHPIYASFLLIVWFTPVMTTGHLLLSILMTIYLFLGSWIKDRRLLQLIGEPYRSYMATVPSYPGFHWGQSGVFSTPTINKLP